VCAGVGNLPALAAAGQDWLCRHDTFDGSLILNIEMTFLPIYFALLNVTYIMESHEDIDSCKAWDEGGAIKSGAKSDANISRVRFFFSLV
jgi:hypothetical protein